MTPAIEKILAQLETLTAAEREQLKALLERRQGPTARQHASFVSQIKGKYSFVPTSSEDLAAGTGRNRIGTALRQ